MVYLEVPRMRSNLSGAISAAVTVLATLTWGSASNQAQDIKFSHTSDMSVQLVSYAEASSEQGGALRAAFLADEPTDAPQEPNRLAPSVRPAPISQSVQCASGVDCGAGGSCGLDVTPDGHRILNRESACDACATCPTGDCGVCHLDETCEGHGSVYYAEVQIMWLRAHVMEDSVGKLSEQFNWSPRAVAGYENEHGIGARGRYWHYSHETPILGGGDVEFQFDTIDIEGTARFSMRKADLVLFGGMRWATIELGVDGDSTSTGAPGLTFGGDGRIEVCRKCNSQWAAIGGARWTALGGDWEGSSDGFVPPVRDDNMIVQEIYGGVEYLSQTSSGYTIFARLTFEIQNWHSDAMSQLSGTDSIGFVGPGVHAGATF
jgi:hypothetical protein